MKIKVILIILFPVFSLWLHAQNKYPDFPKDQHSYLGSYPEFFKDFHKILIDKNLKPCENKKEFFNASILIKSENSAELLDLDSTGLQKNKCSFELTKEVIKYMDKWMPAKIDEKEVPAIKRIPVYPDDLFENYKEGYNFVDTYYEKTDFNIAELRKEVVKKINLNGFGFKGKGKLTVITKFTINYLGKLDDLKIENSSGSQRLDEMIMDAIKQTQINKHWKPAKTHEMPINSYFSFPITVSVD
ncbi:energy transducer TonB [Epilithonimonas sp. UC225_85]|uniref:energy transducer TonB n=1 Tax=Epilithonimonas sp. UC225_85 TaxID=3350167 RepID=UPI0036D3E945